MLEKCPGHIFFKNPQQNDVLKIPPLPGSKIPLLAIHKIISHIRENRSRKVNNDELDLRFFHGNFRPVISQAVRKPCFSTSIPRGPNLCILGPPTWARLGPTHLGLAWTHVSPAWAHPLGPGLGPPTWAQLGPTHLGPSGGPIKKLWPWWLHVDLFRIEM